MENPLLWARSVLASTPKRWTELTGSLSPELLKLPPAVSQWSALECLQHLIDTERVFQFRVQAFLAGQDFPAFNPEAEGTPLGEASPPALAADFVRLRGESLKALEGLTPADLTRRARHQELGPVTLGEMLHEWAGHDLMHTVQAERSLMQPFIQSCGPWQRYFSDHIIQTGE